MESIESSTISAKIALFLANFYINSSFNNYSADGRILGSTVKHFSTNLLNSPDHFFGSVKPFGGLC